jgi:hypothetical protein
MKRTGAGLLLALWLLAGCPAPGTPGPEEQATLDAKRQQQINTLDYAQGQVELIVSAQEQGGSASVSPGGHWLAISHWLPSDHAVQTVLMNLTTGNQREFTINYGGSLRWLEDDYFVAGPYLYHAPDVKVTELEEYKGEEYIEMFRGAENVYLLTDSGGIVLSTDPAYPYQVVTGLSTQETEAVLGDIPYTTIAELGQRELLFGGGQAPSPDGRYYATYRCPTPVEPSVGHGICIFDKAREEMMAAADKRARNLQFAGWAYDSSGIYFQSVAATDAENAYFPAMPIYKLLVPGAALRGTPAPVATQAP